MGRLLGNMCDFLELCGASRFPLPSAVLPVLNHAKIFGPSHEQFGVVDPRPRNQRTHEAAFSSSKKKMEVSSDSLRRPSPSSAPPLTDC